MLQPVDSSLLAGVSRHQTCVTARRQHYVGSLKGNRWAIVPSDFNHEIELRLAFVVEHIQEVLPRDRIHGLAACKNLRRYYWFLIFDRAAANNDVATPAKLPQQQINRTPARDCAKCIETAGKRRLLVIAIR